MIGARDGTRDGSWTMKPLGKECRVLLLEDGDVDRAFLTRLLASKRATRRYEMELCSRFDEAAAQLERGRFDVVLLDLGLSAEVDVATLSALRERADCPILVISGLDDEAMARMAMREGAQEFMSVNGLELSGLERTISHSIERYRLMAELSKAKQKAEAASQAKSDFLAVMSHEFRTPMNGILGGINLLSSLCKDPQAADLLNMMRQCAESQLTLIGDVLDISKIESGSIEMAFGAFSPRDLIASVLSAASYEAREKGIQLAVSIDPNLPRELVSDARRVRQVLMNLVGNAVKFTQEGEVRIHARKLEGRLIEFRVTDTGIGIAARDLDSIFETFTQVDSSYSRRYQGTGLGLAICKRLVKMLGGTLRVDSALGKGSDFHFTIACAADEQVNGSEPSDALDAEFARRHPLSLLVVEDNDLARNYLVTTLRQLGYRPQEAASGAAALERVERERFDAIFMDIRMPDLDGFETAERVLERYRQAGLAPPFLVAVTAAVSREIEERCGAAGIPALLGKPTEKAEIMTALRSARGASRRGG